MSIRGLQKDEFVIDTYEEMVRTVKKIIKLLDKLDDIKAIVQGDSDFATKSDGTEKAFFNSITSRSNAVRKFLNDELVKLN